MPSAELEFTALNLAEAEVLLDKVHDIVHLLIAGPQNVIDVGAQETLNLVLRTWQVVGGSL